MHVKRDKVTGLQLSRSMMRLHAETQGWTTMQRTQNTRKLTDMINENIDKMPREVCLLNEGRSVKVVSEGEILNIHIMKTCARRGEEHCLVEESEWTCWELENSLLWQQKFKNAESFNVCSYYEQQQATRGVSNEDDADDNKGKSWVASMLEMSYGTREMCRVKRTKKQKTSCCEDNCVGRVKVTSFVMEVLQRTSSVYFVSDRSVARNAERNNFSTPKAVNICYTGTVSGTIDASSISSEMCQANKRGPCGSEIHVDTSMGVMQIFGNNGGSRKITCKAFLNISDANFIVRRVCRMVHSCFERNLFFLPGVGLSCCR